MKDAFGAPQSLLVLGGTSEIGLATARRLIARRTRRVHLAGRPSPALDSAAQQLRGLGAEVHVVGFDALDPGSHEEVLGKVFAEGDIDAVLLAFGVLGDQARDEQEPLSAVRVAATNYTGAVSASLVCGAALQRQGHGSLVVLSSVAGERARRENFIYGSSKAGLDAYAGARGRAAPRGGACDGGTARVRPDQDDRGDGGGAARDDASGGGRGDRSRLAAAGGGGVGAGGSAAGDGGSSAFAAAGVSAVDRGSVMGSPDRPPSPLRLAPDHRPVAGLSRSSPRP